MEASAGLGPDSVTNRKINTENWNMAWEHENKLEHDDLWLCATLLWFKIFG